MADRGREEDSGGSLGPGARLPYQKPTIAWEQPLQVRPELMAGCSKVSTMDPLCDSGLAS